MTPAAELLPNRSGSCPARATAGRERQPPPGARTARDDPALSNEVLERTARAFRARPHAAPMPQSSLLPTPPCSTTTSRYCRLSTGRLAELTAGTRTTKATVANTHELVQARVRLPIAQGEDHEGPDYRTHGARVGHLGISLGRAQALGLGVLPRTRPLRRHQARTTPAVPCRGGSFCAEGPRRDGERATGEGSARRCTARQRTTRSPPAELASAAHASRPN
jgi:hypothetical protein